MSRTPFPLLVLAPLLLGAGCGLGLGPRTLTLAEVQAMNPGLTAQWLLQEYPQGRVLDRWPDGQPRRVSYRVTDPSSHGQTLVLDFDARGVAVAKRYSGRILRPPQEQGGSSAPPARDTLSRTAPAAVGR